MGTTRSLAIAAYPEDGSINRSGGCDADGLH